MICSYGEPTESELHFIAQNFREDLRQADGTLDRNRKHGHPALALLKLMRTNGGPTVIAKERSSYGKPTEVGAALGESTPAPAPKGDTPKFAYNCE